MEGSKYQIGDTVTIKRLSSEDDKIGMYRFGLSGEMIALSGKSFKIEDICSSSYSRAGKVPDDGYRYELEGEAHRWSWASSMFEESSEALSLDLSTDNSLDAFIKRNKRPELDFNL